MPTFAIEYVYDHRDDVRATVRPSHRAFLADLVDRGVVLASGPWTGPVTPAVDTAQADAEGPAGALLLVRADSADAALAVLDDDPFQASGLIAARSARGWEPVLGPWSGDASS